MIYKLELIQFLLKHRPPLPFILKKPLPAALIMTAILPNCLKIQNQRRSCFLIWPSKIFVALPNCLKVFINEAPEGSDGYVSLEVSPFLALDTEGTTKQAAELWEKVDRKNVMIKIPGTKPGLQSIKESIAKGININVTLLFGLQRYEDVTEAYNQGWRKHFQQDWISANIIGSQFFLSRIDVIVDPMLGEKGHPELQVR